MCSRTVIIFIFYISISRHVLKQYSMYTDFFIHLILGVSSVELGFSSISACEMQLMIYLLANNI